MDILLLAKREQRTVVTAHLDYPRLLVLASASNPSLILFRGGNWSDAEVVRRMSDVLNAMVVEVEHSIVVVDRDRIRKRRLPIAPA